MSERAFLDLTDRRLRALRELAREGRADPGAFGLGRAERTLARRILRGREALWHDGAENLVRGHLDAWARQGPRPRDTARLLLVAARALLAASPPPPVLWCFLWELEALLPDVVTPQTRAGSD